MESKESFYNKFIKSAEICGNLCFKNKNNDKES